MPFATALITTVVALTGPPAKTAADDPTTRSTTLAHCVVTLIDEVQVPAKDAGVLISVDGPRRCRDGRGWLRCRERRPERLASGVEVVGHGLVEDELWNGLGVGEVDGGRLIEEVDLGRSSSG